MVNQRNRNKNLLNLQRLTFEDYAHTNCKSIEQGTIASIY